MKKICQVEELISGYNCYNMMKNSNFFDFYMLLIQILFRIQEL